MEKLDQIQADNDIQALDSAYKDHVSAFWERVAAGKEDRNAPPPLIVGESWQDAADVVERFNADLGFEAIKIGQALSRKTKWGKR